MLFLSILKEVLFNQKKLYISLSSLILTSPFILLPAFTLILGCDKNRSNSTPLEKKFRYSITTEPPTLDWNKAMDITSSTIIDNIMEGLIAYDFSKQSINYKPALSHSWESQKNGQIWIFHLREDVYWTDGVPFTGQHIIDSWERLLNPKTGSAYAYFLFHIKNAKEYNNGQIKDFSKVGVRLTPKGSLQVELTGKKHYFPYILTHSTTYPIRKDIIERHSTTWTLPKNIVTLGSYILKLWEHDKQLILEKNTNYYQTASGNVNTINIKIIPELSTALNLFDSGKLDLIDSLPSSQIPFLKKRPEFRSHPRFNTFYLGFNTTIPPFNNVKVRKAIVQAIDRSAIVKIFHNEVTALQSWIPKGLFGFNPNIGLPFNPQKAQALLNTVPQPLPKISLAFNTHENNKKVAENIQAQLKKNLNLNIELMNEEWKMYLNNLRIGNIMFYRMGWVPDYPDPHNFMNLMTSSSENNFTKWLNPAYDSLVEKAGILPNNTQRQKLYNQAQKILIEQSAVVVPLFQSRQNSLLSSRVQFYPENIMGRYIFKDIILH